MSVYLSVAQRNYIHRPFVGYRKAIIVYVRMQTNELWNICSQDCSFPRLFVPMVELSFSGTNGPWTIRSLDRSFPGTLVPGNE